MSICRCDQKDGKHHHTCERFHESAAIVGIGANCMMPAEHPNWCRCKEANAELIAEVEALKKQIELRLRTYACGAGCGEKLDVDRVVCGTCVSAKPCDRADCKRTSEALRESHARETKLNRKVFDIENTHARFRQGVAKVVSLLAIPDGFQFSASRTSVRETLSKLLQAE